NHVCQDDPSERKRSDGRPRGSPAHEFGAFRLYQTRIYMRPLLCNSQQNYLCQQSMKLRSSKPAVSTKEIPSTPSVHPRTRMPERRVHQPQRLSCFVELEVLVNHSPSG